MFQTTRRVTLPVILACCISLATACVQQDRIFTVQADGSDYVEYAFGGGELGAEWHEITIRGDGQIEYHYVYPYAGEWPQAEFVFEYSLSAEETQHLFQGLVDARLYGLETQHAEGGADIPQTVINASLDGHELAVSVDGTPDEPIHNQMTALVKKVHQAYIVKIGIHVTPEDNYYAYSEFTPDGFVEGGHISDGFVHMEEETITQEQVTSIWEAAARMNPTVYPLEPTAIRDCVGCNQLFIHYADGQVMRLTWPFGEAHPDPAVQALVQVVVENNTGGW